MNSSKPAPMKGLGLALGGGGMKGWAHVGVLSVLEKEGIRPGIVAGCSIGAVIGAYYAFGYSVRDMVRFMREQRTPSLFSFRFDGQALLHNEEMGELLREQLEDCTFADMAVPFHIVTTDLATGKEVIISRGPVVDAVMASAALPGVFAPVVIDGRTLVDGGLCNNVPVSVLVSHGARWTIAVRLHHDSEELRLAATDRPVTDSAEKSVGISSWAGRLAKTIRGTSDGPNGLEVVGQAMEIAVSKLERYRMHAYPPDVLIQPDVGHIRTLSFSEEREDIFSAGSRAAEDKQALLRELSRQVVAADSK